MDGRPIRFRLVVDLDRDGVGLCVEQPVELLEVVVTNG